LKIIFGQIDQASETAVIKQHLAVTILWAQAKLALYWLRAQVEAYGNPIGKDSDSQDFDSARTADAHPEQASDPDAQKLYDMVCRLRDEFIASL